MASERPGRRPRLSLEECVRAFLGLAMLPPEKEPRTQRAQRENQAMIVGFNRAQEMLRNILELNGRPSAARLADVRAEGQQRPVKMGSGPGAANLWMMG